MRMIFLALLVMTAVGCKNTMGPVQSRQQPPADDPLLTIEEQKRLARFQYSYPINDRNVAPDLYIGGPSPTDR